MTRINSTAQGILPPYELKDLHLWLLRSANNKNAVTYENITQKIVRILRVRRAVIRRGGRKVARTELSRRATELLRTKQLSKQWFKSFFSGNPDLKHYRPKSINQKRQKKYNEKTVEDHSNGRAGLKRELSEAGILEEDGTIQPKNSCEACLQSRRDAAISGL